MYDYSFKKFDRERKVREKIAILWSQDLKDGEEVLYYHGKIFACLRTEREKTITKEKLECPERGEAPRGTRNPKDGAQVVGQVLNRSKKSSEFSL